MGFYIALLFLTRIPLPHIKFEEKDIIRSLPYFPVVGAVIGIVLALVNAILQNYLPAPALACLIVVVETVITGGLHIDGFADTMDGLFCGKEKSVKLDVMKDSRLGAFGVMGVVALFLLKYSALVSVPLWFRPKLLFIFPVISRWVMTWSVVLFPYIREKGLGKVFSQNKSPFQLVLPTVFCLILAFAAGEFKGIILAILSFISGLLFSVYILKKIGGMTGDTYGAVNEFSEIAALYIFFILGKL
ncbi:cobalamin-5'-phosphate synthase [Caldanaerovirga acetigignens]|uniref:Adenosylcobinamide-GDP ribazoletransferase n=1 Tax=Caldanaerovirga acetigignens TaxID=447595 RepID=A0A1M7LZX1_9FIRM|nr:adenosylcobinamide-GDP ribazoletransferase [Caldanaerovirga acetigignens]SHM83795.1 cobalamin-5'-phosphate synthase [Caldanaerovirga acetigignens]